MADHTVVNLLEVEDAAPKRGLGAGMESHFARVPLGLEKSGPSHFRIAPGFGVPWAHRHGVQEEVYVVLAGALRVRLGDESVDLAPFDALRIAPGVARGMQGGPDGAELLAYGAPNTENKDSEPIPGFWPT